MLKKADGVASAAIGGNLISCNISCVMAIWLA